MRLNSQTLISCQFSFLIFFSMKMLKNWLINQQYLIHFLEKFIECYTMKDKNTFYVVIFMLKSLIFESKAI